MRVYLTVIFWHDDILKASAVTHGECLAKYTRTVDADGYLEWFVTFSVEVADEHDSFAVSDCVEHLATLCPCKDEHRDDALVLFLVEVDGARDFVTTRRPIRRLLRFLFRWRKMYLCILRHCNLLAGVSEENAYLTAFVAHSY